MFDFGLGATELMLIAVVALIVVGPKELPALLRTVGALVSRVRALAGEFKGQLDELMEESGVDDIKKTMKGDIDSVRDVAVADLDAQFADLDKEFQDSIAGEEKGKVPAADDEALLDEEERAPMPPLKDEPAQSEKPAKGEDRGGKREKGA
ncbi:MAG TPA: twin-arginine translocase subunit TatB [Thermopetrobacter sp.]|nr:twin-arginine translocase subunit TatB [Thermopetrobacter sp.]